jgi:hypothetical protein
MRPAIWISMFALAFAVSAARAATFRVMQDGSGDYTDIQVAVDAAAPGDTIRIGPGQWTAFHSHHIPGWSEPIQAIAFDWNGRNLTFIGSGPDETVLGPSADPNDSHYNGIMTLGSRDVVIGLTIVGVYSGIYDGEGGILLSSCWFGECSAGLYTFSPEGATVTGCTFTDCGEGILCLDDGNNVHVSDCTFSRCWESVNLQGAWQANYSVTDCTFTQGKTAVQVLYGRATIQNCHATAMTGGGEIHEGVFHVLFYADANLENCSAQSLGIALFVADHGRVTGTNLVFDAEYGGILTRGDSSISIHQSHLLNGGGHTVEAIYYSCPDSTHLDLTSNYWRTTDVAQIESWIFVDQAHGPNCVVVDYLPLADGPVQARKETWGGIKALFR